MVVLKRTAVFPECRNDRGSRLDAATQNYSGVVSGWKGWGVVKEREKNLRRRSFGGVGVDVLVG